MKVNFSAFGPGASLPKNEESRAPHHGDPASRHTNQLPEFRAAAVDVAAGAAGAGLLFAALWLIVGTFT